MTTLDGDNNVSPPTSITPHIKENFVRDELTKEFFLPLTSEVVLKRKREMLYAPLHFDKNLTIDALVESRAYVSAIVHDELDTNKTKGTK